MKISKEPKECVHLWEVAVFEYKKMDGSITPTHSVANVVYCKNCLAMKQLSEEFYKSHFVE